MKTNFKFLAMLAFLGLVLHSCSSDDNGDAVAAPVISNFEYGEGSDHGTDPVAYRGSDIHMEADIFAEGGISSITVSIHAHDLPVGEGEVEWDFEETYSDPNYQVLNLAFHEHIDIPDTAPAGEYHIELVVTDELGNSTEVEGHIDILAPITISDFSMDESVIRGNDIHVEFMIDAPLGIHNVTVDIHGHDITVDTAAGEVEWDFEMEYEEGLHGVTEAEFHPEPHIEVPATAPAGEYHVEITIEDEAGNTEVIDTDLVVTAS